MSHAFPDVQVKANRNSILYVNLVSVVDCSVLNLLEQKEPTGLASDDPPRSQRRDPRSQRRDPRSRAEISTRSWKPPHIGR